MNLDKYLKFVAATAVLAIGAGVTLAADPAATTQPQAAAAPAAGPVIASDGTKLDTTASRFSYFIGVQMAGQLKSITSNGVEVDMAAVSAGLKDGSAGGKLALSEDQIKAAVDEVRTAVLAKVKIKAEEMKAKAAKAGPEGAAFLEKNKTADGVKVTASGLQYKVLKEGTGKLPAPTDTVTVNYKGSLVDGTEFESSEKNGGPVSFPVNGVIAGWVEGLQLMKVGAKYQFFIPANLAYGDHPQPGSPIPANSALIFEVELLSIAPAAADPAAAGGSK